MIYLTLILTAGNSAIILECMSKRCNILLLLITTFLFSTGCNHDNDENQALYPYCEFSEPVFTSYPGLIDSVLSLIPLGNLNPSGHTFPTDHHYLNFKLGDNGRLPILAVCDGWISIIKATENVTEGFTDYVLTIQPCNEFFITYGHLSGIPDELYSQALPFDFCNTYTTGAVTYYLCEKHQLKIPVFAGDTIGYVGQHPMGYIGIDIGCYDERVNLPFANDERFPNSFYKHAVSLVNYYSEAMKDELLEFSGDWGLSVRRTVEPLEGVVCQDIAGTAQGVWFNPAQPDNPEDPHLALVYHNVLATKQLFSVGTSIPGLGVEVYSFTPESSGTHNRNFSEVTHDGQIYTYSDLGAIFVDNVLILQLTDENTLKIELQTKADGPPWNFTDNYAVFIR